MNLVELKNSFQMSEIFHGRNLKDLKTNNFSASCNLLTQYDPLLANIKTIIKKHLPVLHSSYEMLQFFQKILLMLRIDEIKT